MNRCQQTERLEIQLQKLNVHQELDAFDREWQIQQSQFSKVAKEPSGAEKVAIGVGSFMAVAFAIFWTIVAGAMFPPFAFFGVLFTIVIIANVVSSYHAREKYGEAHAKHESQRHTLLDQARRDSK